MYTKGKSVLDDKKPNSNSIEATPQNSVGDIPAQEGNAKDTASFIPPSQRFTADPRHTQITRDPSSTSGYFRMLLAALPARYAFRGNLDSFRTIDAFGPLKTKMDSSFAVIEDAVKDPKNTEKQKAATTALEKYGMVSSAEQHLKDGVADFKEGADKRPYREFTKATQAKIKNHLIDGTYDTALGVGSLAVTASYEKRVYDDIKDIFSEAVAYETEKNPDAIGYGDLRHSNNNIVTSTLDNFIGKTQLRLGTDLGFFGRAITKPLGALHPKLRALNAMRFGDIMIGAKGALLINEVMKKDTTIFTDLLNLIDNKVNPEKGLGEPITSADVIDLYQKYSRQHNPQAAFTDTTIFQQRDQMEWPQAEQIFLRVADLMNQTYLYKHSSLDDMSRLESVTNPNVDFALPKLIYLLGNDMIDARKPEESYAYVEMAGKQGLGIEAVKEAKRMVDSGIDIDDVAKQFGIDLSPVETLKDKDGSSKSYKELKEERVKVRHGEQPNASVTATTAQHEFLEDISLQR